MKILIYLGHPAHFHNYKNPISRLQADGHRVAVLIKKKDILEDLLRNSGIPYYNILEEGRKNNKFGILIGTVKRTVRLYRFCREYKPDILTGTSVENSFIGKLRHIPVININEDDAAVVPLYAKLSYPWASRILCPTTCDCGKWNYKAVKYEGYHELAYLHPANFSPDRTVVEKYFSTEKPFFLFRFASLKAHHDSGVRGINSEIAQNLIDILSPFGDIYITSERPLEPQFEKFRIAINPLDIHHVMSFADLYIGDSQTMAAEAGVLGTPFVRFNDFVGRIGYLNELEHKYQLGFGIKPDEVNKLYSTVDFLVKMENKKELFRERRQRMLADKIDFSEFLTNYIENYPI